MSPAPRKALPIHAPLSVLGVMGGLIAAGIIVPSCTFSESQAGRLHVSMPVAMPAAFLIAALWLARYLLPKPGQRRRAWIGITLGMTLTAETLFNLVAALVYEPADFLGDWMAAFLVFAPLHVGLFPAVILIVLAAREAAGVRPASLLGGVARRQVWLFALGSVAPLEALLWTFPRKGFSLLARLGWWASVALLFVILGFVIEDARAARRLARLTPKTGKRPADEPAASTEPPIDLGIGDETHVSESVSSYRSSPRVLVLGDPEAAAHFIERARYRSAAVLVVAVLAAVVAALDLANTPAPEKSRTWDMTFPMNRC